MNPEHIDWVFLGAVYFCGFGCGMMCWYFILRYFEKMLAYKSIEDKQVEHFEKTDNGGMSLSPDAWKMLLYIMVHTEYAISGPFKKTPIGEEEEILKLRQMFIDDGFDIEVLT